MIAHARLIDFSNPRAKLLYYRFFCFPSTVQKTEFLTIETSLDAKLYFKNQSHENNIAQRSKILSLICFLSSMSALA
jgi:hypothetical protein